MNTKIKKGDFVKIGKDIGVVITLETEKKTPQNHLGIWFGEIDKFENPVYRTVPIEYCKLITSSNSYH